ncbi:CBO0543 family protein [Cytobacillus praedii]|uniref:CBO0543 family protein n=1 Tax=Cytobacillus praedii TaxID=1742358 RepID=UPI003F81CDBB
MGHKIEKRLEISTWVITSILLLLFLPRKRLREAVPVFLFKQFMTWFFGLLVVESGRIKYPIRLFFKNTTKSSFTFEYFVYPSFCALFNLYYPAKRNKGIKFLYYFAHTSLLTVLEFFIEKYTKLITYKKWGWYWSFSSIWVTYYISRVFHNWFFKDPADAKEINEQDVNR